MENRGAYGNSGLLAKPLAHKRNYAQGDENTVSLWKTAGHTETRVCLQNRWCTAVTMKNKKSEGG